ncbi:hypothetical protein [Streptomyces glaucus]|uniref:Secreted protein n=1 Tax=Streptomyces glaucus TaxID=284029 RepID=A0ABP5X180_9ACTN
MMPAHREITGSENPELFRVHKPSGAAAGLFGLALIEAAHLSGLIPDGPAAGALLALAAAVLFARECVYRRR